MHELRPPISATEKEPSRFPRWGGGRTSSAAFRHWVSTQVSQWLGGRYRPVSCGWGCGAKDGFTGSEKPQVGCRHAKCVSWENSPETQHFALTEKCFRETRVSLGLIQGTPEPIPPKCKWMGRHLVVSVFTHVGWIECIADGCTFLRHYVKVGIGRWVGHLGFIDGRIPAYSFSPASSMNRDNDGTNLLGCFEGYMSLYCWSVWQVIKAIYLFEKQLATQVKRFFPFDITEGLDLTFVRLGMVFGTKSPASSYLGLSTTASKERLLEIPQHCVSYGPELAGGSFSRKSLPGQGSPRLQPRRAWCQEPRTECLTTFVGSEPKKTKCAGVAHLQRMMRSNLMVQKV